MNGRQVSKPENSCDALVVAVTGADDTGAVTGADATGADVGAAVGRLLGCDDCVVSVQFVRQICLISLLALSAT